MGGKTFGDKGSPGGEFPADTEPNEKAEDGELDPGLGEAAKTGKDGIHEDGDHHGAGAAEVVADHAKNKAADGPPEHETHGDGTGASGDIGRSGGWA